MKRQPDGKVKAAWSGNIIVYTTGIHMLKEADDAEIENCLNRVPLWRRQRILSYRGREDRLRSLACSLLFAEGCAELGWDLKGVAGENGKPVLSEEGHFISLAHSGEWAAVAFSREPVGIDVEEIRRFTPERRAKVGKKILTDAEINYLSQFRQFPQVEIGPSDCGGRPEDCMAESEDSSVNSLLQSINQFNDEQAAAFARIWTRKEAFAKRDGKGLSMDFRMIDTMQEDLFYSCELGVEYVMSVCGVGPVEIRKITIEA